MDSSLAIACENYRNYAERILEPAAKSFLELVSKDKVELHQAFGTNLFLAHAIDYIQAVRRAAGMQESRALIVKTFDERYGVDGGRFRNRKFELIDAINNALKHIKIDEKRYPALITAYGTVSFNCLVQDNGRVLCLLDRYRFDYSRVILRPAIEGLIGYSFEENSDVIDFATSDSMVIDQAPYFDDDDPIDQMIAYCNPECDDCGESESTCQCGTFVYDGAAGTFAPNFNTSFDFDGVMSQISGAYRKND